MKTLLITKCSNSLMWYRNLVGQVVPLVRYLHDERCWLSREPDGFVNIVRKTDAVVLPPNHFPLQQSLLVQQGDFFHRGEGQWVQVDFDQIGKPAGRSIMVRPFEPERPKLNIVFSSGHVDAIPQFTNRRFFAVRTGDK